MGIFCCFFAEVYMIFSYRIRMKKSQWDWDQVRLLSTSCCLPTELNEMTPCQVYLLYIPEYRLTYNLLFQPMEWTFYSAFLKNHSNFKNHILEPYCMKGFCSSLLIPFRILTWDSLWNVNIYK